MTLLNPSLAALRNRNGLRGRTQPYEDAIRYLRDRRQFLNYADCRRRGLPIGSGIPETACKTIVTYRFKQSGMKWSIDGGQAIIELRVLKLSRLWDKASLAYLASRPTIPLRPPTDTQIPRIPVTIAA